MKFATDIFKKMSDEKTVVSFRFKKYTEEDFATCEYCGTRLEFSETNPLLPIDRPCYLCECGKTIEPVEVYTCFFVDLSR